MSKITCEFCDIKFGSREYSKHLIDCICEKEKNNSGYLIEFTSKSPITKKKYFIYAIFGLYCTFEDINLFLREEWCDCCQHLSTFDVIILENNKKLKVMDIDFDINISIFENAEKFIYEYDMGTPTIVEFKIIKKLNSNISDSKIDIIFQNKPHILKCECNNNAKYTYLDTLLCDECYDDIDCEEQIDILVNSPRTGICGYEGKTINL